MNSVTFVEIASHAVPAIWAAAAFYLVWGTEKSAPIGYPVGMGFVAGLLWLGTNEVPVVLVNHGLAPGIVDALLLIAAGGIAIELVALTIRNYNLGHRSKIAARVATRFAAAVPTIFDGDRELDDTDAEPPSFVDGVIERLVWLLPPHADESDAELPDDDDDADD